MILTGFADPDKPSLDVRGDHAPESERRQNAKLSVPPQALAGVSSKEDAWDNERPRTEPPPKP